MFDPRTAEHNGRIVKTMGDGVLAEFASAVDAIVKLRHPLGERDDSSAWITRYYLNPLVPWIWVGALVIIAGGFVSLSDRRHRVGAPARRLTPASAAQAVP